LQRALSAEPPYRQVAETSRSMALPTQCGHPPILWSNRSAGLRRAALLRRRTCCAISATGARKSALAFLARRSRL